MSTLFVNKVMHACHQHESSESLTRIGGAMTALSTNGQAVTGAQTTRPKSKSYDKLLSQQVMKQIERVKASAKSYHTYR